MQDYSLSLNNFRHKDIVRWSLSVGLLDVETKECDNILQACAQQKWWHNDDPFNMGNYSVSPGESQDPNHNYKYTPYARYGGKIHFVDKYSKDKEGDTYGVSLVTGMELNASPRPGASYLNTTLLDGNVYFTVKNPLRNVPNPLPPLPKVPNPLKKQKSIETLSTGTIKISKQRAPR